MTPCPVTNVCSILFNPLDPHVSKQKPPLVNSNGGKKELWNVSHIHNNIIPFFTCFVKNMCFISIDYIDLFQFLNI